MINDQQIWEELSAFESRAFIKRWFETRHSREKTGAQSAKIASSFTQGREYFASAKIAAASVRPLLLYYGALSLSRGMIQLLNPLKKEENLRQSHGLEVVGWQNTLSGGLASVLDLKVRCTNGTFSELVYATGNRQATGSLIGPTLAKGFYHVEWPQPNFLSDHSQITLDDLLSRDVGLQGLYSKTTQKPSRVHLSEVVLDNNQACVSVFYFGNGIQEDQIYSKFKWPPHTKFEYRVRTTRHAIGNFFTILTGDNPEVAKQLVPMTQFEAGDLIHLIEDFQNGDRLSELLRSFLLSYYLGMLVRYFPSYWIASLRNEQGDIAQPVLMAAVNSVASNFPKLTLQACS